MSGISDEACFPVVVLHCSTILGYFVYVNHVSIILSFSLHMLYFYVLITGIEF